MRRWWPRARWTSSARRSASPGARWTPSRAPAERVERAREAASGVGEIAWGALNSAPETPLNGPIGPHRRVTWVRMPLAELKEIKNALGGTVNDVFLAIGGRGAAPLAAHPRDAHRGAGDPLRRAGVGPRGGRRRRDGQPDHGDGRQAADLRGRPRGAPARGHGVDEGAQGVQAGARRAGDRRDRGLRAADDLRPRLAAALLEPDVQPADHQRAGAAVPALPARAGDEGAAAGGLPGARASGWRSRA